MNRIKLTLPADIERTPEIDAWLRHCEDKINAETELRMSNLLVYGTSHPEIMLPATAADMAPYRFTDPIQETHR